MENAKLVQSTLNQPHFTGGPGTYPAPAQNVDHHNSRDQVNHGGHSHVVTRDQVNHGGHSHVVTRDQVVTGGHSHVNTRNSSQTRGNSHVVNGGHSHVVTGGHSHVVNGGHSHVVNGGHSHVNTGGHSHNIYEGQSRVVSGGHSHNIYEGNSNVVAGRGSNRVITDGHSHVVSNRGSNRVITGGHSHLATGGTSHVVRHSHGQVRKSNQLSRVEEASHLSKHPKEGERRSIRRSEKRGQAVLMDSYVTSHGEGVLIDEHACRDQESVVEINPRESHVVSRNVCESRVIDTHVCDSRVINTYENVLKEVRSSQHLNYSTVAKDVYCNSEQVHVNEIIREKFIDVIVEKAVPRERIVEVPYDVYVEIPHEIVIEKEIITEKTIEIVTDVIVEIPVEKIIEYPIEKIIEKPVYIEEIFEIPVEVIIEDEIEYITENIIYEDSVVEIDANDVHKYHGCDILPTICNQVHEECIVERPVYVDNVVEQIVEQPYDNVIEQEVVYECHIDAPYDVEKIVWKDRVNFVEKFVDVPYETHVDVEHIIEQPVYIDNVIRREIPVERICEHVVERQVENVVERHIEVPHEVHQDVWYDRVVEVENIIEEPVYYERVIQRPYYTEEIVERPVENKVYNYYDVIREVEVPVENVIIETIERPVERCCENHIEEIIEHPVERRVENRVPVENIVYVDKVIEEIVENHIDNYIEKVIHEDHIIEQEVYYEVEKLIPVEHVVEVVIEVKKEIITEIQVDVEVKREVYIDVIKEVEVLIENSIERPTYVQRDVETEFDIELSASVDIYQCEYDALLVQRSDLEELLMRLLARVQEFDGMTDYFLEVSKLRRRIATLEVEISTLRRNTNVNTVSRVKQIHVTYSTDPKAAAIRHQIEEMRSRNKAIKQKIDFQNERISYGACNYQYEETEVEGKMVRQVRKSNRYKQNANVTVSHANDAHLVSKLNL